MVLLPKGELVMVLGGAKSGKTWLAREIGQSFSKVIFVETLNPSLKQDSNANPADSLFLTPTQSLHANLVMVSYPQVVEKMLVVARQESDLLAKQVADNALRLDQRPGLLVFDSVTLWLAQVLTTGLEQYSRTQISTYLRDCVAALIAALGELRALGYAILVISSEVGMGVVPEVESGRLFRSCLGRINIELAKQAGMVVQMTAGIPLLVKFASSQGTEFSAKNIANFLHNHK